MILSKRMQMVVDLLPKGLVVADVGCDHGFVSIYLVENKISPKVIAMDVNAGPLSRAEEHIKEYHLEKQIQLRLSDGLKEVDNSEIQAAIIAGMGGRLILKILSEKLELVKSLKAVVLQPQSDWQLLRKSLNEMGFVIEKENMVEEDGKYYPAFRLSYQGQQVEKLSQEEARYGPLLLKEKNRILLQYIKKEKDKFQQIENNMQGNGNDSIQERIQLIEKALCYFN